MVLGFQRIEKHPCRTPGWGVQCLEKVLLTELDLIRGTCTFSGRNSEPEFCCWEFLSSFLFYTSIHYLLVPEQMKNYGSKEKMDVLNLENYMVGVTNN